MNDTNEMLRRFQLRLELLLAELHAEVKSLAWGSAAKSLATTPPPIPKARPGGISERKLEKCRGYLREQFLWRPRASRSPRTYKCMGQVDGQDDVYMMQPIKNGKNDGRVLMVRLVTIAQGWKKE
jgi:hypothetical protein